MKQARFTRDRVSALSKPDLIDLVMKLAARNALLQTRLDELEKQNRQFTRDRVSALSKPDLIDLVMKLAARNALLQTRFDELEKQNRQLQEQNASLVQRVSDLEQRLGLNSSNSSKPPSSDGLAKPAARERRTRSLRGKSGRKSGGQHGHKGTTLKQVATPDALVHHYPHQCTRCSATLSPEAATGFSVRQVFGLAPPPPLFITEHRAHTCLCRATPDALVHHYPHQCTRCSATHVARWCVLIFRRL